MSRLDKIFLISVLSLVNSMSCAKKGVKQSTSGTQMSLFSDLIDKNQERDVFPDPPAKILFLKHLKDVQMFIAFDGTTVIYTTKVGIFSLNISTGKNVSLRIDDRINPENSPPLLVTADGALIYFEKDIYSLSEINPPKVVWSAKDKIRWSERKKNYAMIIDVSGDIALVSENSVKIVGHEALPDANSVTEGIDVRASTTEYSRAKRFNNSGETISCEIPGLQIIHAMLSKEGSMAFGFMKRGKTGRYDLVGYDCFNKKLTWKKEPYREIFQGPYAKGVDVEKQYSVNIINTPVPCGNVVCTNLFIYDSVHFGKKAVSGVYCLNQKTGEILWKDTRTSLASQFGPIMCRDDRLISFSQFDAFAYTQKFPALIDQPVELFDQASQRALMHSVKSDSYFTNVTILPVVAEGKVALVTSNSDLLVFGN